MFHHEYSIASRDSLYLIPTIRIKYKSYDKLKRIKIGFIWLNKELRINASWTKWKVIESNG